MPPAARKGLCALPFRSLFECLEVHGVRPHLELGQASVRHLARRKANVVCPFAFCVSWMGEETVSAVTSHYQQGSMCCR